MTRVVRTALIFSVVVAGYAVFREFGTALRFPISDDWFEALLKLSFWVAPCAIALRVWGARSYRDVAVELGLGGSAVRGYFFAAAAAIPMLVAILLGGTLPSVPISVLIGSVVVGPFAEEILFRGWLMRQLTRRAGWPPVAAVLVSALTFGLAHVANLAYVMEPRSLSTVASAAAAGLLFGWLVWRWDSLWPAIGLHACINLSSQADGTTMATIGRLTTIALAVVLTFIARRVPSPGAESAPGRPRRWANELTER